MVKPKKSPKNFPEKPGNFPKNLSARKVRQRVGLRRRRRRDFGVTRPCTSVVKRQTSNRLI